MEVRRPLRRKMLAHLAAVARERGLVEEEEEAAGDFEAEPMLVVGRLWYDWSRWEAVRERIVRRAAELDALDVAGK